MPDTATRAAPYEWQIGVFCQNEGARIDACLRSVARAIGEHRGRITVILNGSTDDSEAKARALSTSLGPAVDIVRIAAADKSNAINRFLYDLRVDAAAYFCVDGYVTISPKALRALADRLSDPTDAVAATGVAGNGRNEPKSRRETVEIGGVMHGQLYALRPDFVRRMIEAGVRLPVGLYRGDGLLGSMAAHDLDATGQPWRNERLAGVADAVFEIDALSPFRWRDWRRQYRRKVRQMRGLIENAAIKTVIYEHGYAALPTYADDLIGQYLAGHPAPPVGLADRWFMSLALSQHRAAKRLSEADLQPHRVEIAPG